MAFSIPHHPSATHPLQTRPKTVFPAKWTQGAAMTATGGEELVAVCAHFT